MLKFIGISVSVLFCSLLLKDKNKTFSVILSVAGGILLFITAATQLGSIINSVYDFSSGLTAAPSYIGLMLKVLGITLITQFVCDICRDNGEGALADMTETVAKIVVISMILPLFETVIGIVSGLLK